MYGMVSVFSVISTFESYLIPKPFLLKNNGDNIRHIPGNGYKRVRTFPKCISLKVKLIARLEFEHTFFVVAVQHISHYTTGT